MTGARRRASALAAASGALLWVFAGAAPGSPSLRASPEPKRTVAAGPHTGTASESQRFAAFLEQVYRNNLADRPQLATEFEPKTGGDRWDDISPAAQAARAARARRNIQMAKTRFDYVKLDAASQVQHRVFIDEQQLLLDRYRWRSRFYALNQIVGLHVDVPGLLTGQQPLESEQDARAYIRRIGAVRPLFSQLVRNMKAQAAAGVYMPRTIYPLLIEGARNVITGAPHSASVGIAEGPRSASVGIAGAPQPPASDSPIFADFKRRVGSLSISDAAKAQLVDAARAALVNDLQPAYEELLALLDEQARRTPIDGGVWQLPEGDAFYAFLIRQFTTTDMTPQQIHDMGLAEVARAHAEIDELMHRVGFHGTVREFMAKMKTDPHQYVSNDDAGRALYLAHARDLMTAMQAKITTAFYAPAPLPLLIKRTDPYKEASSPEGFYEPGSADGTRPGTVYLNLADMRSMPLFDLDDLFYHEGLPGHHMQISTITVDPSIPRMRKVNEWWQDSAFVEGWGLYAERLAKDLGFYQDPYAEFGLLSGELWRATRLVVDSGLHYKHWSRDQAIAYLNDNTPTPPEANVRAVDRYLAVPGQATSFMVGMRRFVAERERARQALGSRFDLREYHRLALSSGYIPLWALTRKVDTWIGAGGGATATAGSANAELAQMFEAYWQDLLRLQPSLALERGDTRYEDRFDDSLEEGWRTQMLAMVNDYLRQSAGFSRQALSDEDRTSLSMMREQLEQAKSYYGSALFETARRLPIEQFQGLHTGFAADAAGSGAYPFKTVGDYDQALRRADAYARWTDDAIARLKEGVAAGVVLPRMVVERVLPQLRVHFGKPPDETEFWHPIANLPKEFAAADRTRLEQAYRAKIAQTIEPAYRRLHDFLQNTYLPHARATVGLGQIPGGLALYRYDVRHHTTSELTPDQIHSLGVAEVTKIEAELAKVEASVHFTGTVSDFYAQVRNDPAQKFASRAEIIPAFEAARARIVGKLPMLFDVFPKAEFQIRALPESSRQSQGNGYYSAAGANGSRPGILWINTFAPGITDKFNVTTLTLHEGLPGHHFQTSVAQERVGLPSFRRFDFTNAYGEGWALYSESLGKEMGLFDDPWQYYGHLNYAILRANRLVIDTGLHASGWTVEQGVQWMMQHSSMTHDQAAAEVERYVAYPGQALSYKIGELRIRELRARAEGSLGAKFDIKGFHDQILLGGSMPLTILTQNLDRWIAATRTQSAY